jgi:nucleotide-binding universal stress UspA family protein
MYRRLLVPLDGSRLAEAVLPMAERLAQLEAASDPATIMLLHVLEQGAPAAVHGERHLRARGEAEEYLSKIAAQLREQGLTVENHTHEVPEGDVPRSIASHAVEERADLIVLCTHGSGGVRHLLFGSVAQQVLKRGALPVLLARPSRDGTVPPFKPDRLLVPLDGTAAAEAALEPARHLAKLFRASVHLVMVVATGATARGELQAIEQVLPAATRATLDLEELEAAEYLEHVAARLSADTGDGVRVSTEVRRGDTSSALADEAGEPGVGLIVVATHGRAGVQAIWTGSVTARLLARTRAPILLLRTIES